MTERSSRRHWWLNHEPRAHRAASDSLWIPAREPLAPPSAARHDAAGIAPGDLLLCYERDAVARIACALGRPEETVSLPAGRPRSHRRQGRGPRGARAGTAAADRGWRLPVRWFPLERALLPRAHLAALRLALSASASPLRRDGRRNPAVPLALIGERLQRVLRELLGGQLEDIEGQCEVSPGSELAGDWIEEQIRQRTDVGADEKRQLLRARRGEGAFRYNVEKLERACRLSGLLDRRHLRACHIKPWSACDDRERLDGCNGLLLSPQYAHLFLRGYISFEDDGTLLVSRHLNPAVLKSWHLPLPLNVGAFLPQQRGYLAFHRGEVFERPEQGRRRRERTAPAD